MLSNLIRLAAATDFGLGIAREAGFTKADILPPAGLALFGLLVACAFVSHEIVCVSRIALDAVRHRSQTSPANPSGHAPSMKRAAGTKRKKASAATHRKRAHPAKDAVISETVVS